MTIVPRTRISVSLPALMKMRENCGWIAEIEFTFANYDISLNRQKFAF